MKLHHRALPTAVFKCPRNQDIEKCQTTQLVWTAGGRQHVLESDLPWRNQRYGKDIAQVSGKSPINWGLAELILYLLILMSQCHLVLTISKVGE